MHEGDILLRSIHKNAEMGKGTIPVVLDAVEDPAMQTALRHQLSEYETVAKTAEEMLQRRGLPAKDPGAFQQAMSGMMIRAQTLTDKSPSHVAEMMIRGSTMGTVQMTREIHRWEAAEEETVALAKKLLQIEERNIQQMKKFL